MSPKTVDAFPGGQTQWYYKNGWSGDAQRPDLLCPHCREVIGSVGAHLRVRVVPDQESNASIFHASITYTHVCGHQMRLQVVDLAARPSVMAKMQNIRLHNRHLESEVARLVAEAAEKEQVFTKWTARLISQEAELTPARDLEAANRRLAKELAEARAESEKLRGLAERRYAELSSLREAATK